MLVPKGELPLHRRVCPLLQHPNFRYRQPPTRNVPCVKRHWLLSLDAEATHTGDFHVHSRDAKALLRRREPLLDIWNPSMRREFSGNAVDVRFPGRTSTISMRGGVLSQGMENRLDDIMRESLLGVKYSPLSRSLMFLSLTSWMVCRSTLSMSTVRCIWMGGTMRLHDLCPFPICMLFVFHDSRIF